MFAVFDETIKCSHPATRGPGVWTPELKARAEGMPCGPERKLYMPQGATLPPTHHIPVRGDMFKINWVEYGLLLVTTNASLNRKGELVMGRGAASMLKSLNPKIPALFGEQIKHLQPYRLLVANSRFPIPGSEIPLVGGFQVKRAWSDKADLDIIKESCIALDKYMRERPRLKVIMNYPGVGNGGLDIMDVQPVLDKYLPQFSRLTLCYLSKEQESAQEDSILFAKENS